MGPEEGGRRQNVTKHGGVSFGLAKLVFADPFARTELEGHDHGEERWRTIGAVRGVILLVSHTAFEKGGAEVIRIISARKATPKERRHFEEDT